jgi:DNA-binding LytR/AlgR family response regulator
LLKEGEHMAYRVAIVDDSSVDAAFVEDILNTWADNRQVVVQPERFDSAEKFLFRYADDKAWDILLLDIEMGAMDGVTMAKRVRQDNEAVQIVFITGYSDYIAEGYEVAALHYLMKPVNREKLLMVLDRAMEKRKQEERCLNLEAYGEMVRIPFYEIRYLDVHQNYVTVHAKADYTVKRTLGDVEKELDERFFRVGRGMILNLKYIQRVTKTEVRLSDGAVLPLPRGAYEPLNRAIIQHT